MGNSKKSHKHFRNDSFLKEFGQHCKKLRIQKGYSIGRLAKEGELLSSSVVHRLESGSSPVTIATVYRYAQVLQIPIAQLFNFSHNSDATSSVKIYAPEDEKAHSQAFKTLLPLYSLKAAAGYFGKGEAIHPEGWIEVRNLKRLDRKMFIARAVGKSMLPKIKPGDFLIFRADPEGPRQGKIVLAQHRSGADPETGGSYTVKKYSSEKIVEKSGWKHKQITLSPLNPDFKSIVITQETESDLRILAEYIDTLEVS